MPFRLFCWPTPHLSLSCLCLATYWFAPRCCVLIWFDHCHLCFDFLLIITQLARRESIYWGSFVFLGGAVKSDWHVSCRVYLSFSSVLMLLFLLSSFISMNITSIPSHLLDPCNKLLFLYCIIRALNNGLTYLRVVAYRARLWHVCLLVY